MVYVYLQLFDAMAEYDLPIWMHPARGAEMSDYRGEDRGRYEMWWCFGFNLRLRPPPNTTRVPPRCPEVPHLLAKSGFIWANLRKFIHL